MSKTLKLIIVLIFTTFYFDLVLSQVAEPKIIFLLRTSEPYHWSRRADLQNINEEEALQDTEPHIGKETTNQWQAAVNIRPKTNKTSPQKIQTSEKENLRPEDTQLPLITIEDLKKLLIKSKSLDQKPLQQHRLQTEKQLLKQNNSRKYQTRNENITENGNGIKKAEMSEKKAKTSAVGDNALVNGERRDYYYPGLIADMYYPRSSTSASLAKKNTLRKGSGKTNCVKKCFKTKCEVSCLGLLSSASCSALACRASTTGNDSASLCAGEQCNSLCVSVECVAACEGRSCISGCRGKRCHSAAHGKYGISTCKREMCFAYSKGKGVESKCTGKQCEAHCEGKKCTASCNGDSCIAMCGGEKCRTKCKGKDCIEIDNKKSNKEIKDSKNTGIFDFTDENLFSQEFSHENSSIEEDKYPGKDNHPWLGQPGYGSAAPNQMKNNGIKKNEKKKAEFTPDYSSAQDSTGYYGNKNQLAKDKKNPEEHTQKFSMGVDMSTRLSHFLHEKISLLSDRSLLDLLPNLGLPND